MSGESALASPFQMLGDPTAAACVGDVCEIPSAALKQALLAEASDQLADEPTAQHPEHPEQAVVNRRLDEDLV